MYASVKDDVGHPGRYEGLTAFEIWLVQRVEQDSSWSDEETGDVEFGVWVARVGKRLVSTDSNGFWYVENYETDDAAGTRFDLISQDYDNWNEES